MVKVLIRPMSTLRMYKNLKVWRSAILIATARIPLRPLLALR